MTSQLPNRPLIQKHNHHRDKRYLQAAKDEQCLVRSTWCNGLNDTTVAAHSNFEEDGKGAKVKADDWCSVYACSGCHNWLDKSDAPQLEKRYTFNAALKRTIRRRIEQGLIKL